MCIFCRDAWNSQRGISKTEAKRRYISSLIDNMTRYATSTPEARELVAELSFVWDQIKNMSPQQSSSSEEEEGGGGTTSRQSRVRRVHSRGEGLHELEPRSSSTKDWEGAAFSDGDEETTSETRNDRKFRRRINRAIEALRADVAELQEKLRSRNETRQGQQRDGILLTLGKWIVRFVGVHPPANLLFFCLQSVDLCVVSSSTCIV